MRGCLVGLDNTRPLSALAYLLCPVTSRGESNGDLKSMITNFM